MKVLLSRWQFGAAYRRRDELWEQLTRRHEDVTLSLGGFVLIYTVLGIIDVLLMFLTARARAGSAQTAKRLRPGNGGGQAGELVY